MTTAAEHNRIIDEIKSKEFWWQVRKESGHDKRLIKSAGGGCNEHGVYLGRGRKPVAHVGGQKGGALYVDLAQAPAGFWFGSFSINVLGFGQSGLPNVWGRAFDTREECRLHHIATALSVIEKHSGGTEREQTLYRRLAAELRPMIQPPPVTNRTPAMSNPRTLPTAALLLHEQAHLVPEMHPDEYKPFAADVKKRGVQEPIKLIPGTKTVIDGRTRLKAATDAGLPSVPVEDADLGDLSPVAYMLHKALYRRNLKPGQRAALGNEIAKQLRADARQRQKDGAAKGGAATAAKVKGEPSGTNTGSLPPAPVPSANGTNGKKNRGGETAVVAAQIAGSNAKHVRQAGQIEQKAPEVYEQVKAGTLSVPAAVAAVKAQEPTGTLLSKIPKFPPEAVVRLARDEIHTVEDLDAKVAELRKQPGRDGVGRFNVLRASGLVEQAVKKAGDALDAHFSTAKVPPIANLLSALPNFPPAAAEQLARHNVTTLDHFRAEVMKLRKERGDVGASVYETLRELNVLGESALDAGDAIISVVDPATIEPATAAKPEPEGPAPCPFCRSDNVYLVEPGFTWVTPKPPHFVACRNCNAHGPKPKKADREKAIKLWNKGAKK